MSTQTATTRLQLPLMAAGQAQKHVTHNEALLLLDASVQLSVDDADRTTPPAAPSPGDRHIVAASAVGLWMGRDGEIAVFDNGIWQFLQPQRGWRAWVAETRALLVHDGNRWSALETGSARTFGINAVADQGNRLAVSSPATLLNHEGAGHRLKINKAAAAETASLLFQTGFSGRAEMGLAGNDDFGLKVSADGAGWKDALAVNRATGAVRFPHGVEDAATGLRPVMLLPAPVADIWRSDMDAPATPRVYTIAGVSGASVTITTGEVEQFYNAGMRNAALVRIWNVSKSPAQAAWVCWNNAANVFSVRQAAQVAGWLPGEILRIGDPNPTGANVLQMVAIDIGDYLFNAFGAVFRQRGLKFSLAVGGVGGRAGLDISGSGAAGTAFGSSSNSDGARQASFVDVFTTEASPVSGSNLLFVRETVFAGAAGLAATRLLRLVGVWA